MSYVSNYFHCKSRPEELLSDAEHNLSVVAKFLVPVFQPHVAMPQVCMVEHSDSEKNIPIRFYETNRFLSRVSILTCDIDIANLSVHPSVRYVPVSDKNGLTYRHSFFTIR